MARSMSGIVDLSHGATVSSRGSGAWIVASWLIGIVVPYDWTATMTPSTSLGVARPVRTLPSSFLSPSIAPSMSAFMASRYSSTGSPPQRRRDLAREVGRLLLEALAHHEPREPPDPDVLPDPGNRVGEHVAHQLRV